eukprot:267378_1
MLLHQQHIYFILVHGTSTTFPTSKNPSLPHQNHQTHTSFLYYFFIFTTQKKSSFNSHKMKINNPNTFNSFNNYLFAISLCITSILMPIFFINEEFRYHVCWFADEWTGHKIQTIHECANNAFEYWQDHFAANETLLSTDSIINACPVIDGQELIDVINKEINNEEKNRLISHLVKSRSKPIRFRGLFNFTNSSYDINFWINELKNIDQSLHTTEVKNVWNGVQSNILFNDYIQTEKEYNYGSRFSFGRIENSVPKATDEIISKELLSYVFPEYNEDKINQIHNDLAHDLMVGIGRPSKDDCRLFHTDPFVLVNVQLYGSKKWVFVEPKYLYQFRPSIKHRFPFVILETPYGVIKPANYDKIPRYECIMKAGDVLYFPPHYLHKVDYLYDPIDNDFSISLASAVFDLGQFIRNSWQLATLRFYTPFVYAHEGVWD